MRNVTLSDLEAFACVARHQSFRRAALERGVSVSLLSQTVRRLEEQLGVGLLTRTTRSVAPTEAGEELLANIAPAFSQITGALDRVNRFRSTPLGLLRINAPAPIAQFILAPLAGRFLAQHPDIRLEIYADAGMTDIVQSGFDAGVRFDEELAQDMVAISIGLPQRYAVVASADYLAARARPQAPQDLAEHSCIRQRFPGGTIFQWTFLRGKEAASVLPLGPLTVNDAQIALNAARHGAGFAYIHENYAQADFETGKLVRVLEDWSPGLGRPSLYFPKQRYIPASLRAFIDFLKAENSDRVRSCLLRCDESTHTRNR
jgi:DNA-binding transcriptional LysR family regulator